MHPRNIYNKRLDFKSLAADFPEFKKVTILDLKGQVSLDFKDVDALRILSKTLLKKDFNLEVHFPQDSLIPTIPLRLNYILFIEDLLDVAKSTNIKGIDIGTGASCIYPLIAARKNNWQMVGTDIDCNTLRYAQQNITDNKLNHLIKVVQVKKNNVLKEILEMDTVIYDFCMCNPPFFSDANELCSQQKRKDNRSAPKNAYCAKMHEVITEGGELEFVRKIIDESTQFCNRIKIYSSMLGVKRTVKPLLEELKQIPNVKSAISTEFRQGNTTRYFIAWTFNDSIDLTKTLNHSKKKKHKIKPYIYTLEAFNSTIEDVDVKLKQLFNELELRYTVTREAEEGALLYNVMAYRNTWCHSRRKRRELARFGKSSDQGMPNATSIEETTVANVNEVNLLKRQYDDTNIKELDHSSIKKLKTDETSQDAFLDSIIKVHVGSELCIEMNYVRGLGGKDAAHQVLQYIKNNLGFN